MESTLCTIEEAESFDQLPPGARQLVHEIQGRAMKKIGIARLSPENTTSPPYNVRVNREAANLVLRDTSTLVPESVLHELLHIRRVWGDGVPPFKGYSLGNDPWLTYIDNALEHLVIVPQEKDYGGGRLDYWRDRMMAAWKEQLYRSDELVRQNCLLGLVSSMRLVDDSELRTLARDVVARKGLTTEAEAFAESALSQLHCKESLVRMTLDALRIPRNSVYLQNVDPQSQQPERIFL
jgi:hypothetical protein